MTPSKHPFNSNKPWWILEIFGLISILGLASYLRLVAVENSPGWFADEGVVLNLAQNLLKGQIQYLAIGQSMLLIARMPLFPLLLAGLLRVTSGGIEALRMLTGFLGVLSVALLYLLVRRIQGRQGIPLAFLAAFCLAIYPQAVVYSRLGYSYNLLPPLILLMNLGLWEYLSSTRRAWLGLASLMIGIGILAEVIMTLMIVPLVLIVLYRRWRDLLWSVPLLVLPVSLYAVMMLARAPQSFLYDVHFITTKLGAFQGVQQIIGFFINYTYLLSSDIWSILALIGTFTLRPLRWRYLNLLLFLIPFLIVARTNWLFGLGYYYLIPLLPFTALGVASLIRYGVPVIAETIGGGLERMLQSWPGHTQPWWPQFQKIASILSVALVITVMIGLPVLNSLGQMIYQVQNGFSTVIDEYLLNPKDARSVAAYVNNYSAPEGLIVASPGLAWLLDGNVSDFQIAIAAEGERTVSFPMDLPPSRFVFDPHYQRAQFIVVDNLWRNWGIPSMPAVTRMLEHVKDWPLVEHVGEFEVYRNPAR
jgi:hypothetical protein